ncbi:MAG TPA: UPF0182 family protein, partial [Gemmatimonadales bacterium]
MSTRRLALVVVALFFAALFFLPPLLGVLVDWWWFQEIGYRIVFTRTLLTRILLFLGVGGLAAGVLLLNLRIAQRGLVANPILLQIAESAPRLNATVALRRLSTPIALGVGLLAGFAGTAVWSPVLLALYGGPFGIADPVFSRDVGFYVFTLPALSAALALLVTLAILSLVLVAAVYAVRGDLAPGPRQVR